MSSGYLGPRDGGYGQAQMSNSNVGGDSNPFTTPGSRPNSGYFPRDDADHMTPLAPAVGSGAAIPMSQSSASMASRPLSGVGGSNRDSMAYQNIPSDQYWNEPTRFSTGAYAPTYNDNDDEYEGTGAGKGTSNKKKWIIGGVVLGVLAIAGIVAGVVVSQMNKKSGGSGNGSDSGSSGSGSGNGTTDLSNPSQFDKDSRLHQSFWAIAYTPEGSRPPSCGANIANVTRDIQILSQLTTRIRLYGANCNDTALVMQAVQDTKVDMTIWPAIYVDSDESAYEAQVTAVEDALKTYGTDMVEGIIVGNEFILNDAGAINTSSLYTSSVDKILARVDDVRQRQTTWGLTKELPIGTSDAGSTMSTQLATGIDFFMANVHPFFGNQAIQTAAAWTSWFFENFDVAVAATAPNNPKSYIAETGWPTKSLTTADSNSGAGGADGEASVANLQTFLDTFVCQANANGTEYFFFEAFDEPWKAEFGGVEPFWGMFDENRNLKDITIPVC